MNYDEYLAKSQGELNKLMHLVRIYMPPFLKQEAANTILTALKIMDQYMTRLELDLVDIPDPF